MDLAEARAGPLHRHAEVAQLRRSRLSAIAAAGVLLGCGVAYAQSQPNPTTADIQAFLQQNWPRFEDRFGRLTSHAGQPAELVSVQNLLCVRYEGVSECSFDLTARYPGEADVTHRLWDGFRFDDDGKVTEVSIIINDQPTPR